MTPRRDLPRALAAVLDAAPTIEAVDLLVADNAGLLRGKRVPVDAMERVGAEGLRLPGSMFSMDATGRIVHGTGIVAEEGERDRFCRPVEHSFAPVPWSDAGGGATRAQALTSMYEEAGEPFFGDPRQALARVAGRFKELKLVPTVAAELEFYLVAPAAAGEPPRPLAAPAGAATQVYAIDRLDAAADFLAALHRACAAQNIPTETAVAESGPGHFEVNLRHQGDPLVAADHAILFKRAVRAVAARHGARATFMAKPFSEASGSGLHFHVSLVDARGENVFAQGEAEGNEPLGFAVGGLLAAMREAMLIFAPNANSYRRFQPGAFVPTLATWGINNRTTALRIPPGGAGARRIEHRVAGADANVYLALAAILAGIHHGITGRIAPPAPAEGDASGAGGEPLPRDWAAALAAFESARILPAYLDPRFCALFLRCRAVERERFEAHVSPLEHEWYLDAF